MEVSLERLGIFCGVLNVACGEWVNLKSVCSYPVVLHVSADLSIFESKSIT